MKWWRRDDREEDLERELRSHLDAEMSDQQEQGLSAEEARSAARRAFGNPALVREEVREMWSWGSIERLLQDIRFSFRTLRKSPGFTVFAVLALALGLGANAAIFSVVDAVLLRSLPFRNADRLVEVWEDASHFGFPLAPTGARQPGGLEAAESCLRGYGSTERGSVCVDGCRYAGAG